MMIPQTRQRLEMAVSDLQAYLVGGMRVHATTSQQRNHLLQPCWHTRHAWLWQPLRWACGQARLCTTERFLPRSANACHVLPLAYIRARPPRLQAENEEDVKGSEEYTLAKEVLEAVEAS